MKVVYAQLLFKIDADKLSEIVNKIAGIKAVVTVSQFSRVLEKIKAEVKGLILGCNVSVLKKFEGDTIIFIGDGIFHPLNIKKSYKDKKVLAINPYTFKITEITNADIKRFIFSEAVALDRLKTAKDVGIIVSTKNGQNNSSAAIRIKNKLEKDGKNVYLFLFDTINPEEFLNFKGLDLLINTACPRISMDDAKRFEIPVLDYKNLDTI